MPYRAFVLAGTLLALVLSLPSVRAQTVPDAARLSAAKEMMQVAGVAKQFEEVMPLLLHQLAQGFVAVAPDKAQEIREVFSQLGGKFNAGYGIDAGNVGYLREPCHGEPYATKTLVPEAFRYGRARITAADLQKRLPDVLHIVDTRERLIAFTVADEAEGVRVAKQYLSYFHGPTAAWECARKSSPICAPS